jgi:CRP/FNR family transcriptional regulator, polysaccharide utilization system transcription regulator
MDSTASKHEVGWLQELSLPFLTEDEIHTIEKASVRLTFKKAETILKQGGQSTHIAYLEKGIVKFNYENEQNRNLILAIVSSPKILGGANLFYQNNNLFSIVALESCSVILIEAHAILQILRNNALFSFSLLQLTSEMFKKTIINFVSLASKHKEGRIADIIIHLAENVYYSDVFQLTLTRKELAEFSSCSPENVIMTLSRWQKEQIIRCTGKEVEIIDMKKLKLISKNG